LISSFLITELSCKILRRQSDSVDDDFEPTYDPSDEIDYLFRGKISKEVKEQLGENIQIDGYFIITESVSPGDKILFDGYEYDIVPGGIFSRMKMLTGQVEYYMVVVSRRREYNEAEIAINSKVD